MSTVALIACGRRPPRAGVDGTIDRLPDIALVEQDIWQPERPGLFVLGAEQLPVRF